MLFVVLGTLDTP